MAKKDRIYVCHTFYHVYISVIKELNLSKDMRGNASLVLSTMSNDFGNIADRILGTDLFTDVYMFDEKEDVVLPEVMKYHEDRGNLTLNLLQRIKYTKALGRAQEEYVPVDFKEYKDIYVFCDLDPIGYYLNYKKIRYHALEDGLDTVLYCDNARFSNIGHFEIKAFMAKIGLIFIENGYSKYCIDMEVNNAKDLKYPMSFYKEVPRKQLTDNVAEEDRHYLIDIFMENPDKLLKQVSRIKDDKRKVLILSDPVCDLVTRKKIMRDIINRYCEDSTVFIKPHPRDVLDYDTDDFSDCIILKGRFPMEMMNYFPELHMNLALSIFTTVDSIEFADEKIKLGADFMDEYEDPVIHRENEQI
ncbi:MAG: glycosyltransferase family 52 protein [Lachnospiraceae bacterium]|nr:glycosyltransferase family 52 protein [Lachnospiraceae bacterium]